MSDLMSPRGILQDSSYLSGWRLPAAVIVAAVGAGISSVWVGWYSVLAIVFLPLLICWPVSVSVGAFAFLIPSEAILAIADRGHTLSLTSLTGVAAASIIVFTALAARRLKAIPTATLWWGGFVLWAASTTLWAVDPKTAARSLPAVISLYVLFLAVSLFKFSEKELRSVALLCVLGGVAAAVLASYEFETGQLFGGGRGSLMLGSQEANPNSFGIALLLPFALAFAYVLTSRRWWSRIASITALSIIFFAILLTMSRSALLSAVLIIGIYLYHYRGKWKRFAPAILIALLLLAMPKTFFVRLQESSHDAGAGRLYIWKAGLRSFEQHAIVGAGLNNFSVTYQHFAGFAPQFMGFDRDSHNIYLQMGVDFGLVGILLFFLAVWKQFRRRPLRTSSPQLFPMQVACESACWAGLAAGFFGNILWTKTFWFSWILLAALTDLRFRSESDSAAAGVTAREAEAFDLLGAGAAS